METLIPIITGISLSACTGFRAFLPPFIIGLCLRWSFTLRVLFPGLAFLSENVVLLALGVAVVVEFLGDKVPWVDHVLDTIELPVKFVVSLLLTYSIIPLGEYRWVILLFALTIGTGTTVTVHAGKAGFRAASTGVSGGLLNPFVSLVEEVVTLIGTLAALFFPVAALAVLVYIMYRCVLFLGGKTGGNQGEIALTQPSHPLVRCVRVVIRAVFGPYNRLRVLGVETLPAKGPYVVVANHASNADGFLMGTAIPLYTYFMVKKEAFENPVIGWFLRKVLCFPIDRERPDPAAIKWALKKMQEGYVLGLFPEGHRNPEGRVRKFKFGAIRLAIKQKVPIVPAYIANSHLYLPDGAWFPRPAHISVRFGTTIEVAALIEQGKTEVEIQDMVYNAVCELGREVRGEDVRELESPPEPAASPASSLSSSSQQPSA
jgi:1-acyl-sn-glycerol-3-phosphate acyltransferase